MNKIVIFGAGKIGRSFIGQLFSRSGYQVVFVDINQPVIEALNQRRSYKVIIKADQQQELWIENVRGVLATNQEQVINEIASASIMALSVGKSALPSVIPLIARGLHLRQSRQPGWPLDIIIAENFRNGAEYLEQELERLLDPGYPLKNLVGLVETSIGKMVPIMTQKELEEDILQVFAEPYNTLILDQKAFKNPIPKVEGLAPRQNMKAWVDRKSFVHNLGHAATAYLGYLHHPKATFIYQVLEDEKVYSLVKSAMQQAAGVLNQKYPAEYNQDDLQDHIEDLLARFGNRALKDTVFRVGLDLERKLGPDDRLWGVINFARQLQMPYDHILYAAVAGYYFRAKDEQGNLFHRDQVFAGQLFPRGLPFLLNHISGLDPVEDRDLMNQALEIDQQIRSGFNI